jgi:hypothetical protein
MPTKTIGKDNPPLFSIWGFCKGGITRCLGMEGGTGGGGVSFAFGKGGGPNGLPTPKALAKAGMSLAKIHCVPSSLTSVLASMIFRRSAWGIGPKVALFFLKK